MVKFKVVISDPKGGKSYQREVDSTEITIFKRKKIGDKIDGKLLGLEGYEFEITGGSDKSGFPMRKDVEGIARKRVLITGGVGLRKARKGNRIRKTVRGNTVSLNTSQINMKILKYGKAKLEAEAKEGEAEAKGEEKSAKEEKGEEKKKEEPKKEGSKPGEKKEKAEEVKEEKADKKEKPEEKPTKEKKEESEKKEKKTKGEDKEKPAGNKKEDKKEGKK